MLHELNTGDEVRINGRESTREVVDVDGDRVAVRGHSTNARTHTLTEHDGEIVDTYDFRTVSVEVVG